MSGTQQILGSAIVDGTVNTADLADLAVTTGKLAANAVTTAKLASAAVTSSILGTDSVDSTHIQDNAVLTASIADDQITAAKIADAAVVAAHLNTNAVTSSAIAAGAVVAGKLGSAAVTATELATNAVTTAKIADTQISTAKLINQAVTAAKIANATITDTQLSTGALHFATDTTSLSNRKIVFNLQLDGVSLTAGSTADITSSLSSETAVTSAGSTEGVITDTPKNKVALRDVNDDQIVDGSSREVYARLTHSSGVWTITYYVDIAGTQTAYSLPGTLANSTAYVPKRYNLLTANEDSFRNAAQFTNNTSVLSSHITQPTGAHMASAIALLDSAGHFLTDNLEFALNAIVGTSWVSGTNDSLNGHITRATGAHAATAVSFAPDSGATTPLASINVNAAIEELHGEVEDLQAAPPGTLFGSKYFLSTNGQTVYSVVASTNAPFTPGNRSLMVFRGGILQSVDAGHYTEDPSGNFITLDVAAALNEIVILFWHN